MSSLPPVAEVIDALLKIVIPAFGVTALLAAGAAILFGKRCTYLTAALAILLGLLAANSLRGVFVTRFDAEEPLTLRVWSRGLLSAIAGEKAPVQTSQTDEIVAEVESESPRIPRAGRYWIPSAVILVTAIEILAKAFSLPNLWLQLVRLVASIVAARLFVPAELAMSHAWLSWSVGIFLFLVWLILGQLSVQVPSGVASVVVVASSFAAATVLIHAHSARLTDAATMIMAASAGLAVVAAWRGIETVSAAPVSAVFLTAIMLSGYHETFSEVPLTAFVLPAASPLVAGLVLLFPAAWRQGAQAWVVTAVCAGVPAVASVILATRAESLSF